MPEKSVLSLEAQRRIARMGAVHSFGPGRATKVFACLGVVVLAVCIASSFPKEAFRKTEAVRSMPMKQLPASKVVVADMEPVQAETPHEVVEEFVPVTQSDAGTLIEDGRLAKRLAELAKKSEEMHQKSCASLKTVSIEVMQKDRILFAKFGFDLKQSLDFQAEKARIDPNADKFLRSQTAEVILIRRLCGQLERAQDLQFAAAYDKTRLTLASLRAYVQ